MACVTPWPADIEGAGEELLSAYLDGELDARELAVVVDHLEICLPCIAVFHDLKRTRATMRTLTPLALPDGFLEGLGVPKTPTAEMVLHPEDALSAYLDGELSTMQSNALAAHLSTCAECRIELQELDAARTAIRALPRLELPDGLVAVAPVAVDGVAPERNVVPMESKRHRPLVAFAAALAGVAAAAVIAINVAAEAPVPQAIDLDRLASHHNARQSVEAGFSVIPPVGGQVTP